MQSHKSPNKQLLLTPALSRLRSRVGRYTATNIWKVKIGHRIKGNIGVMLKTIITFTSKFTCLGAQLFEEVNSNANLKVNSRQFWWSSCFVHGVKPRLQSTITFSQAAKQSQPPFLTLPSFNGFVNLLASTFSSGRVTSGSCRMACCAGHLTAWR